MIKKIRLHTLFIESKKTKQKKKVFLIIQFNQTYYYNLPIFFPPFLVQSFSTKKGIIFIPFFKKKISIFFGYCGTELIWVFEVKID